MYKKRKHQEQEEEGKKENVLLTLIGDEYKDVSVLYFIIPKQYYESILKWITYCKERSTDKFELYAQKEICDWLISLKEIKSRIKKEGDEDGDYSLDYRLFIESSNNPNYLLLDKELNNGEDTLKSKHITTLFVEYWESTFQVENPHIGPVYVEMYDIVAFDWMYY